MSSLDELNIINRGIEVKETLGSFRIFDEIDPIDHPAVYQFIKIVYNYTKISKITNVNKNYGKS